MTRLFDSYEDDDGYEAPKARIETTVEKNLRLRRESPYPIPEEFDYVPLKFGKYEVSTPAEIADIDPSYIVWAYENVQMGRFDCSPALYSSCKKDPRYLRKLK